MQDKKIEKLKRKLNKINNFREKSMGGLHDGKPTYLKHPALYFPFISLMVICDVAAIAFNIPWVVGPLMALFGCWMFLYLIEPSLGLIDRAVLKKKSKLECEISELEKFNN